MHIFYIGGRYGRNIQTNTKLLFQDLAIALIQVEISNFFDPRKRTAEQGISMSKNFEMWRQRTVKLITIWNRLNSIAAGAGMGRHSWLDA